MGAIKPSEMGDKLFLLWTEFVVKAYQPHWLEALTFSDNQSSSFAFLWLKREGSFWRRLSLRIELLTKLHFLYLGGFPEKVVLLMRFNSAGPAIDLWKRFRQTLALKEARPPAIRSGDLSLYITGRVWAEVDRAIALRRGGNWFSGMSEEGRRRARLQYLFSLGFEKLDGWAKGASRLSPH